MSERLPEERHLPRQTFDDGSAEYDRARPSYRALADDVRSDLFERIHRRIAQPNGRSA